MPASYKGDFSMSAELRMTQMQVEMMNGHLLADECEHAAILMCEHAGVDRKLLLCREVRVLAEDDLQPTSGAMHLDISPQTLAHFIKQAKMNDQTLVICHSHPFGGAVCPSPIDLKTERELCGRVIPGRLGGNAVGALVVGPDGMSGRIWHEGRSNPLKVRAGGRSIGSGSDAWDSSDQRYDRQLRIWGSGGQQSIRDSTVAVVGAGGTGSHVVQQLAHLGVGKLILIDPDRVEESNLGRLVGASVSDIGINKVDVLRANALRIQPEIDVRTFATSVLEMDSRPLADADIIVCCTDGHGSRALLTELSAQYFLTLIDLGVEVQTSPLEGTRAGGGVRVINPGEPCLHCVGVIDPALVREEFLTDADRSEEARLGYLRISDEPAPSVIALNGVVASLAVIEVLQNILNLFAESSRRVLYRAEARSTTTARSEARIGCYVCGSDGLLGLGDTRPLPRRAA
jgi:molybdopterin/thiamine biosynthesis adenylyltransferase